MRMNTLTGLGRAGLTAAAAALLAAGCGGGGGGGGGSDPDVGANSLLVVDMDLEGLDGVSLNRPFTIEMSEFVDPDTIRHDTIQVRLAPRYGIQASGDFKVAGNLITFFPQLPTLPDLSDAGFQPLSLYRVTVVGAPKVNRVRAYSGRPLLKSFVGSFATAAATSLDLFTTDTYKDPPPPVVQFTNPPDVLPKSPWTAPGGAVNVPTDAELGLVFNRVPLRPETVTTTNITLTMIERLGVAQSRPIQGTPVVQQSFDGVKLVFVPTFPLADQARYVLRVENRVTDLSGSYDVADNSKRTELRVLAEGGLDTALTAFALAHPEEIDPRTFLIFTTRDEPTKDVAATLKFDGTDKDQNGEVGVDTNATTASFNDAVPGAVAAQFTAAGGNGTLGDFSPSANTTLSTNSPSAAGGIFNFQRLNIPAAVTVTVTGTLPGTLLALKAVTVDGTLNADGKAGGAAENDYQDSTLDNTPGGAGGPGSGKGGAPYQGSTWANSTGDAGEDGPNGGGKGGKGGVEPASTVYGFGGGGGGGGHQYAGQNGANGAYPSYASWNGAGGAGGAAGGIQPTSGATSDGKAFGTAAVTAGGGGAGGNSHYYPSSTNWRNTAASGGGGGGALLIKGAQNITIKGTLRSRGGDGGTGNTSALYYAGAAGGGGGGGTLALYANLNLDVAGGTLDTSGGIGGASNSTYAWNGRGGNGGGGYIQLEDANGSITGIATATLVPDHYIGTFNPTGTASDAPSIFVSTWFNLGVFDPEIQPFLPQDFVEQNYPGCTIKYEMQMAIEDTSAFSKADISAISVSTGISSNLNRASQWHVIKDPILGIQNVVSNFNGLHYQFYRLRITFTLKDGQTRSDPLPYVDQLRIRAKY